jgi:uncharacterized protein
MAEEIGRAGIARAVRSLAPGGRLELGFFGGEPLLDPSLLSRLAEYGRRLCGLRFELQLHLTTNGTHAEADAWGLLGRDDLQLAVSFDGLPELHDRDRVTVDGRGSSRAALATLRRLVDEGKEFRVAMVVGPRTVRALPEGIEFLRRMGVSQVEPSLDLWARWGSEDGAALGTAVHEAGKLWRSGLPRHGIGWFDEKAVRLLGVPVRDTARCGFGAGSIAVAPSGRLYPCERLIGEDKSDNRFRLPGDVRQGDDFLGIGASNPARDREGCSSCALRSVCATDCPCGNAIRTGDPSRPDGLLCLLDRLVTAEVSALVDRTEVMNAQTGRQTNP